MCKRKYSIDYLKFIGIICLVLAHVQAPKFIEEIRGFDVPLMVFLSGILGAESYKRSRSGYKYIVKRIGRLIIPTYIFLVVFYFCMWMVGKLPSWDIIMHSFLFQRDSGIVGYVWIIWIYVLCAVMTPVIIYIKSIRKSKYIYIFLLVLYEVIANTGFLVEDRFFYYSFYSMIPYGLFLTIGILYQEMNRKSKMILAIGSLLLHFLYVMYLYTNVGSYVSINEYKYPARFYFFSYSLPISIVLYEISNKLENLARLPQSNIVLFASRHSLWIYLWHIFFLAIINYIIPINNWIIRFVVVFMMSFFMTWMQNFVFSGLQKKKQYNVYKYFLC